MPETHEEPNENATARAQTRAGVRLIPRKLTTEEATLLHEELKSTPNILGYTVRELLQFTDVIVAEVAPNEEGREDSFVFAGACVSKDLLFNWTDIAVLYVLPAFRSRRIATQLYEAAFARARDRKRHIYTLSRSPQIIALMERQGMKMTKAPWNAPFAVHWHMNCHMTSVYRWREASRKSKMRRDDGQSFVGGTRRAENKPPRG